MDYGFTASAQNEPTPQKFLRITDIVGGFISWFNVPYVNTTEQEREKYKLHDGDIVIARTGASTGESIFIKNPPPSIFASYLVRIKINRDNDPKYISYCLKSDQFWHYLNGVLGDKSAQPNASASTLARAPITIPESLLDQRAIATILGSLDDKIDLNRRTNETLEAMARALFRDWFVDFGPTRAKMAGETPYLAPELWELFPDRLDDEGKPEGWETSTFDHCITILTGGTPKTSVPSYWNGNIPWFSVVDAPTESDVYVLDTTKKITQDGLNNSAASILPENTVIISARGTVGKLALTSGNMTMNQSCYGIRGSNGYGQYFILQALKNILNELKNNTHGSVFDTITRETFSTISTTLPSLRLAQPYENMVSKYFKRILVNCEESRTLSGLRDLLLPKLMSGEISIRDAEKMVEDVA